MTSKGPNDDSGWLQRFVSQNALAMLCGGAVIWSGYQSSTATIEAKQAAADARLTRIERVVSARADFMTCAARTIDRITDKIEIEQGCQLIRGGQE